jgi:hypothetical protein
MAWITITENDIKTRLAGAELSAYTSAAKAQGQGNPLTEIISQVVSEIRGYVAACARNTLGAGATIPDKLLSAALAMIRYRLITRLPLSISEERKREYDDAISLLERVSDCKFAVDEPAEASSEDISTPAPSMGTRTRNFSRTAQDGI